MHDLDAPPFAPPRPIRPLAKRPALSRGESFDQAAPGQKTLLSYLQGLRLACQQLKEDSKALHLRAQELRTQSRVLSDRSTRLSSVLASYHRAVPLFRVPEPVLALPHAREREERREL